MSEQFMLHVLSYEAFPRTVLTNLPPVNRAKITWSNWIFQALKLLLTPTYIFLMMTLGSALPQISLPPPPSSSFPSHISPSHLDIPFHLDFPSHISQSLLNNPSPVPSSTPSHTSLPSHLPLTPSHQPCSKVHTNRVGWPSFALTFCKIKVIMWRCAVMQLRTALLKGRPSTGSSTRRSVAGDTKRYQKCLAFKSIWFWRESSLDNIWKSLLCQVCHAGHCRAKIDPWCYQVTVFWQ